MFKKMLLFIMMLIFSGGSMCLAMEDDKRKEEMHNTSDNQEHEVANTFVEIYPFKELSPNQATQKLVKLFKNFYARSISQFKNSECNINLKKVVDLLNEGANPNAIISIPHQSAGMEQSNIKIPLFYGALFWEDLKLLNLLLNYKINVGIENWKNKPEIGAISLLTSHLMTRFQMNERLRGQKVPKMIKLLLQHDCDSGLFAESKDKSALCVIIELYECVENPDTPFDMETKRLCVECFDIITGYLIKKNELQKELENFEVIKGISYCIKRRTSTTQAFTSEPLFIKLLKESVDYREEKAHEGYAFFPQCPDDFSNLSIQTHATCHMIVCEDCTLEHDARLDCVLAWDVRDFTSVYESTPSCFFCKKTVKKRQQCGHFICTQCNYEF